MMRSMMSNLSPQRGTEVTRRVRVTWVIAITCVWVASVAVWAAVTLTILSANPADTGGGGTTLVVSLSALAAITLAFGIALGAIGGIPWWLRLCWWLVASAASTLTVIIAYIVAMSISPAPGSDDAAAVGALIFTIPVGIVMSASIGLAVGIGVAARRVFRRSGPRHTLVNEFRI